MEKHNDKNSYSVYILMKKLLNKLNYFLNYNALQLKQPIKLQLVTMLPSPCFAMYASFNPKHLIFIKFPLPKRQIKQAMTSH